MYVLAFLALTLPVAANAIEDETAPAAKPYVLVNTNTQYGYNVATDQGYSQFASAARSAGYIMSHERLDEITDEALEDVNVLILAVPKILTDDDKAALRRFLQRGGGLFILGIASSPSVDLSNLDGLLREYGIWFGVSHSGSPITANVLSPLSGPRTANTIRSPNSRGYLQMGSNAEPAAVAGSGYILAAISKHKNLGSGRLVALGDAEIPWNDSIGYNDNESFLLNVLDYLSGGGDLRVTLCKAKRKGGKVKVIAKVRNIGTSASEATIVRFYLSTSNTYPVGPAGVAATLGEVNLPALNPGKSKKVKVKLKIPGWVTTGEYYVIAVADPDGDIRDSNTDNNYKASKKQITIN